MSESRRDRLAAAARLTWMLATFAVVQGAACGLAAVPSVMLWFRMLDATTARPEWRVVAASLLVVPSYAIFAVALMLTSGLAVRLCRWHTPPNAEMRLSEVGWPLLHWVRSMMATHVVRILAGYLFRSSPIWTAYLRLAGARLGRRVYVNSLWLSDYNLLTFGDDVVIGGDVHLSGHTVEGGVVKTAPVTVGNRVTLGLGSVVGIGVDIGNDCQVAAQSLVPKHTRLEPGGTYAGTPVQRLGRRPQCPSARSTSSSLPRV